MAAQSDPKNTSFPSDSMDAILNTLASQKSDLGRILQLHKAAKSSPDPHSSRSQKIEAGKQLLQLHEEGDPERARLLEVLAEQCYNQYCAANDWQSLEDAIDFASEAVEAAEFKEDYTRLGTCLSRCLARRYARSNNEKDLENAADWAQGCTSLARELHADSTGSADDVGRSKLLFDTLSNLWLCLFIKLLDLEEKEGDEWDETFHKMLDIATEAEKLSTTTPNLGAEACILAKTDLGKTYEVQWDRRKEKDSTTLDFLHRGIELLREAKSLLPQDTTPNNIVPALTTLAKSLLRAYLANVLHGWTPPGVLNGESLRDEAIELMSEATAIESESLYSVPTELLSFILYFQEFPKKTRSSLLQHCCGCLVNSIAHLRRVLEVSSDEDQTFNIPALYGIARYAAAAAIQSGRDPYEAIKLLEQGRGVATTSLFAKTYQSGIARERGPELAALYDRAREELRNALSSNAPFHDRREKLDRIEYLQNEISSADSRNLTREQIISLADDKDIVLVNITDIVSDAIIVSKGTISAIHLPDLDETDLSERSWEIQTRLAQETDQEQVHAELGTYLSRLLSHLWRSLAKPVLKRLGYTSSVDSVSAPASWPQICWIPTGVLSLYPIHASGLGLHKDANVMNRVISSYSSSFTSMHYTKQRLLSSSSATPSTSYSSAPSSSQPENSKPSIQIIAMPKTPHRQDLNLALQEIQAISKYFPLGQEPLICPFTNDILDSLLVRCHQHHEIPKSRPSIIHFSCHGEVDYSHPLQSKLLTTDWESNPLTAQKLISNFQLVRVPTPVAQKPSPPPPPPPRLAFLSACFTANAGVENKQDESNHLASALQLAGFAGVIGAFWYVGETAAFSVVREFYRRLRIIVEEEEKGGGEGEGGGDGSGTGGYGRSGRRSWDQRIAETLHLAILEFRETTRTPGNRMRGDPVIWTPFMYIGV